MNVLIGIKDQLLKDENFLAQLYLLCQNPQVSEICIVVDTSKNDLKERMQQLTLVYTFVGKFFKDYQLSTSVYFRDLIDFNHFKEVHDNKLARQIEFQQQQDLEIERETIQLQGDVDMDQIKKFVQEFEEQKLDYNQQIKHYRAGALGGTFNFMHNGHKLLLSLSSLVCSEKLIVGVTNDEMAEKKDKEYFIESFKTRSQNVQNFVNMFDKNIQVEILELKDSMGGWDLDYEVLVVSEETQKAVNIFNEKRKEAGKKEVEGCVLKIIEQNGIKFSSTQMREYLYDKLPDPECKSAIYESMLEILDQNKENTYLVENLLYKLLFFYTQNHRVYHGVEHIFYVLDHVEKISELKDEDRPIVILSLLFHDIIHHPCYKNNEKISADLSEVCFNKIKTLDEKTVKRIGDIIRSTETHDYSDSDRLQNIVSDLDMSVLQLDPKKYKRYVQAIKIEYSMIENFNEKRAVFLKSVLEKEKGPFYTEYFSNEKARQNMQNELKEYNISNQLQFQQ